MKCLLCKTGTMKESTATYFTQLENCYIIIERVPCWKCEQCGETLYAASVMERIDDILEGLKKVASKIFIMDYTSAA